jgi:hypothetical protein
MQCPDNLLNIEEAFMNAPLPYEGSLVVRYDMVQFRPQSVS